MLFRQFRNGCNGPDINGPKVNTGQVEVDTEMDRILLARKSCNSGLGSGFLGLGSYVVGKHDRRFGCKCLAMPGFMVNHRIGVSKWFGFSELRRIGAMARKPIGGGSEHRETCSNDVQCNMVEIVPLWDGASKFRMEHKLKRVKRILKRSPYPPFWEKFPNINGGKMGTGFRQELRIFGGNWT
ncbi:hypothetical protein C8R48DRAFT_677089 [Suillus tomentosus]|nr:hypothetical protein C8R48DRAFT_677089 [Suillus tomentosus]